MIQIAREHKWKPQSQLTLTNALATTPEIPMEEFAGGTLYIKSGTSITSVTYYGAPRQTSTPDPTVPAMNAQVAPTYYQLNDASNVVKTQTVTGGCCYNLPAEAFGFGALKIVLTGVASETVELSMKS